jgi:sphingomyelin phosphodiesterase 2
MFYEGFLYGRWELNALMNVIEELEIYRNQLEVKNRRLSNDGSWNSASLTEDGDR